MADYQAPLRDMHFVLHELMEAQSLWQSMSGTAELTPELANAVLQEAARVTSERVAPLNRGGDEQGVHFDQGIVTTPDGYKEAFQELARGGWLGLGGNPEHGGQGMPAMLTILFEEMLQSASNAFSLYVILSSGAALCIDAHGSKTLKERYLPHLYEGTWTGAMCLTEAHAGSDLGLIRTRAEPGGQDGRYALTGTKIFITGGEHDLAENIIYLVLARLPDAPEGSRGISLFLVPKFKVQDDGSLGERNGVQCGSIEQKMGIHGSSTCVMHFDAAEGFLIGEPHRGLAAMFTMMNDERVSVGLQGLGAAERAWQQSLDYARTRLQGRAAGMPGRSRAEADPIIVHPDVRRMLLTQKALVEGGRAFAAYCGRQLDIARYGSGDAQVRAEAMVALLTPVAKAFMTDKGLESCLLAQQVFGGHGYIREWGVEQLVRDVRISQIYEGTNGIQAMDLVGRKVVADGGQTVALLFDEIRDFCREAAESSAEKDDAWYLQPVRQAVETLDDLTRWLLAGAQQDANLAGAAAVDYLHALGLTMYAYLWARMARIARARMADSESAEAPFYQAKLHTARFFMQRLLPQVSALDSVIRSGSEPLMSLSEEDFSF